MASTGSSTGDDDRLYAVKSIPNKGKGLVATAKIIEGTRIFSEYPVLKLSDFPTHVRLKESNRNRWETLINKRVRALMKDHQLAIFSLHNAFPSIRARSTGIVRTNALPLGSRASEVGLFFEASRINHVCSANAQNTWNATLDQITIHAVKDIEEGEEITITYFDGSKPYSPRELNFGYYFGFECGCEICSIPPAQRIQSDQRRDRIARLDGIIRDDLRIASMPVVCPDDLDEDGLRFITTPLGCLHNAHTLLRLLEEEGISDARIPKLYYDAFQIAIANGDQARAKVFAQRASATRVICEGDDSPESIRLEELAQNPAVHEVYWKSTKWKQSVRKIPRGLSNRKFEDWLWRKMQ
ncbi:MAG: hypothetical protein M1816_003025 [Peltula sp. TS41687]|nr:MAG: hypothetical protein M1816_003025 [Peltula sp. TS41687]